MAAVKGWRVTAQRGASFADRLAAAHLDAGPGPVVQVGMDTPQLTPRLLSGVIDDLAGHDACLGPAPDGGWWALARHDPVVAAPLARGAMSTPSTYDDTRAALVDAGHRVSSTTPLGDVDTVEDAAKVARLVPETLFAAAFRAWEQRS